MKTRDEHNFTMKLELKKGLGGGPLTGKLIEAEDLMLFTRVLVLDLADNSLKGGYGYGCTLVVCVCTS